MSRADHGRLAKNTVFLYVRLILTLGVSLFTSREVLGILGIEDYGIYSVVAGAITMLSFLNGAMTTGTQRFLSFELGAGRKQELRDVFDAAVLLHLGIALIVLVLAETVGLWLLMEVLTIPTERRAAAHWVFQLALFAFIINIIQVPFVATVIANEKMGLYAHLSILESVVKLISVYILMFTDGDKLIIYGFLNAASCVLIALIYRHVCRLRFPECRGSLRINSPKLREMSSFLGWNTFSHVAVAAGVQGVNVLLNVFFGPAINAARGVAMLASDSIKQFASAFQVASAPQITKTFSAGELDEQSRLILFACKSTLFLLLMLALPVVFEAEGVLEIWLRTPPPDSALFLRLILLDALICTSANPMYYAIMATGEIRRYQLSSALINLGNFVLSWGLLANGFPAYTVFCVLMFISILMLCLRLWFLRQKISFSIMGYIRKVIFPGVRVIVVGAILPILAVMTLDAGLLRLLLTCVASFVGTALAIYLLGLDAQERVFVRGWIAGRVQRLRER